jgi:polysaccharide deacetylase 2 family uncharacterized protein YibQ
MEKRKSIIILSVSLFVLAVSLLLCLKWIVPRAKKEAGPKVAIVIDDWGYNLRSVKLLKQIDVPITVSILPNLGYSSRIAEAAEDFGKEVILHLPLEPEQGAKKINLEQHTITADMSEEEIVKTLNLALASVPYARGVSNHMGSRVTKDSRIMAIIFKELRKKRSFFLDNLVTGKSVSEKLAGDAGIRFTSRSFFLDNSSNWEYIREQFNKAIEFALESGSTVAVGHARPATLKVLKDMIAPMQAKGIEFVSVEELLDTN